MNFYALLVDTAVLQEDANTLEEYAPQVMELAVRHKHELYQAVAYRSLGVAQRLKGDYAQSQKQFEKGLEIFRNLNTQWQIGRTYYELGELARVQKNTASASEHYSQALESFKKMRAAPFIERTLSRRRSKGVRSDGK